MSGYPAGYDRRHYTSYRRPSSPPPSYGRSVSPIGYSRFEKSSRYGTVDITPSSSSSSPSRRDRDLSNLSRYGSISSSSSSRGNRAHDSLPPTIRRKATDYGVDLSSLGGPSFDIWSPSRRNRKYEPTSSLSRSPTAYGAVDLSSLSGPSFDPFSLSRRRYEERDTLAQSIGNFDHVSRSRCSRSDLPATSSVSSPSYGLGISYADRASSYGLDRYGSSSRSGRRPPPSDYLRSSSDCPSASSSSAYTSRLISQDKWPGAPPPYRKSSRSSRR